MTPQGFKQWSRFHKCLLCIGKLDQAAGCFVQPEYDAMLDEMEPEFLKLKVTFDELHAASLWMFEDTERAGSKWGTHFAMLKGHILRERARKAEARKQHEKKVEEAKHALGVLDERKARGLEIDLEAYQRWLRIIGRPQEAQEKAP